MNATEEDLDRAEIRAEVWEVKALEMEEELKVVANNLKSLEVLEAKSDKREKVDKGEMRHLSAKLKQAESRAEFVERSVTKLEAEVDMLENELVIEQDKLKAIEEEVESTFLELSGY